jgi:hypothetical protein
MNHTAIAIALVIAIAVILVGSNVGIMQASTSQSGEIINIGGKRGLDMGLEFVNIKSM